MRAHESLIYQPVKVEGPSFPTFRVFASFANAANVQGKLRFMPITLTELASPGPLWNHEPWEKKDLLKSWESKALFIGGVALGGELSNSLTLLSR